MWRSKSRGHHSRPGGASAGAPGDRELSTEPGRGGDGKPPVHLGLVRRDGEALALKGTVKRLRFNTEYRPQLSGCTWRLWKGAGERKVGESWMSTGNL